MINNILDYIDDKYLLASHLQKCVRLGFADLAKKTSQRLYMLDKSYLMYRTQIIAFEDIGIANPNLLRELISFKWGVRQFEALNIDMNNYFAELNYKLAKSNKDRTSCDAICLIKMAYQNNDMKTLSKSFIKDIYQSWKYLGYERYSIDSSKHGKDNLENYLSYINYCNNSLFENTEIIKFYNTQVDPWWIATMLLNPSKDISSKILYLTNKNKYLLNDNNQQFCYSSIDGHTYLGNQLISKMIKIKMFDILNKFNLSEQANHYLLKKCLFRIEGQIIDNKLTYNQEKEIKLETIKKEIEYYFPISWDDYVKLGKEMLSKIDDINEIRKQLLFDSLIKSNNIIYKM